MKIRTVLITVAITVVVLFALLFIFPVIKKVFWFGLLAIVAWGLYKARRFWWHRLMAN